MKIQFNKREKSLRFFVAGGSRGSGAAIVLQARGIASLFLNVNNKEAAVHLLNKYFETEL